MKKIQCSLCGRFDCRCYDPAQNSRKPKIYISGPISNNPNAENDFQKCQDYLTREGIYTPINPYAIVKKLALKLGYENSTEDNYFKIAVTLMLDRYCNDIIMLPNFWEKPSRCVIELRWCVDLKYGVHIFHKGQRIKI